MEMLDLLYPKRCPVCLSVLPPGGRLIHDPCREKIRTVREPVCYKCGKPLLSEETEYCGNCRKHMPLFETCIAWAEYASRYTRRMLMQVKYYGDCQLLDFPCQDLAEKYRDRVSSWQAETLIPVPVHKSRLRTRGYNQAEEIALRLGEVWHLPVDADYLTRTGKTAAQKELNDSERQANLMHAFQAAPDHKRYDTVILVDDIYTTGSTMAACTRVLLASGIRRVYGAVLATSRDRRT